MTPSMASRTSALPPPRRRTTVPQAIPQTRPLHQTVRLSTLDLPPPSIRVRSNRASQGRTRRTPPARAGEHVGQRVRCPRRRHCSHGRAPRRDRCSRACASDSTPRHAEAARGRERQGLTSRRVTLCGPALMNAARSRQNGVGSTIAECGGGRPGQSLTSCPSAPPRQRVVSERDEQLEEPALHVE